MEQTTRRPVVRAFARSSMVTGKLLAAGQLHVSSRHVDRLLTFADGSTSRIYRETVRDAPTLEHTLLVVGFRLRFVGDHPVAHALFRAESLANTPLFAGFPGFRTKLWLTDTETGVYRGIYQWDGAEAARDYAETLCALLRVVCIPPTVRYHVEPGIARDDFLGDPTIVGSGYADATWWRLRTPIAA